MNAALPNRPPPSPWQDRWQRFSATTVRAFHAYGAWLVSISWKRFIVLALALISVVAIVHDTPPFTWTVTELVEPSVRIVTRPAPPRPPKAPKAPANPVPGVHIELPKDGDKSGIDISIGKDGVRITPKGQGPAQAASAAASAAGDLRISVPPGPVAEAVREALAEARRDMEEAVREARRDAEQAVRDADEARRDAQQAIETLTEDLRGPTRRTTRVGIGDFMMQFTLLWVLGSAILKYTYKSRIQAEVKAAQATETAEAESLKRQVVEARMAAMQAQVEPHFLFNTLASIDHLIETDPARASQMQKNLIALLRASMPTMREASGGDGNGVRDLGRELAVIRPYLEILKVRMEERLSTDVQVPDGLLSAEFPPMMIQTLVENAIKHGLEPKAEGGSLHLKAEIVHGKLQVTVADTGLGFGKAATAGTGVGLANIRERLQLLYGPRATLTVTENRPSGTVVTVTVPYKTVEGTPA
ncbi:MAG: sensor histidine kinase [Leptothrix sp. (in: Bacteria)]|nr:sensor histidine kinase [Leptothrix sp. (in: b-proteobacteria)]